MGFWNKLRGTKIKPDLQSDTEINIKNDSVSGVVEFEDFTLVLKTHLVDSLFWVGLPIGWEPYDSDRFRAQTQDGKTCISITNWLLDDQNTPISEERMRARVLPLYEKFVVEGGYEPYDDLFSTSNRISKSFKVDEETQYYLTVINKVNDKIYQSNFVIRDIGEYSPQTRATLLNVAETIKFT